MHGRGTGIPPPAGFHSATATLYYRQGPLWVIYDTRTAYLSFSTYPRLACQLHGGHLACLGRAVSRQTVVLERRRTGQGGTWDIRSVASPM